MYHYLSSQQSSYDYSQSAPGEQQFQTPPATSADAASSAATNEAQPSYAYA